MNEAQLIARVRELFSNRIGDDAAVVDGQVMTADLLVEDVDFTRATPLRFVARKALAVNLSDLAAMGAQPQYALLSLALPSADLAEALLPAFAEMAKQYAIEIVGGDFSRAEKLTIAITAIGRIVTRPLLRSGAKPGDRVYLSRPIGGSATGLALLGGAAGFSPPDDERRAEARRSTGYAEREFAESAIRRQLDPEPEVALGLKLAAIEQITSCIDVSDGLSSDLHHLCDASNCGAEIERERIPVFPDLLTFGPRLGIPVRDVVLHGGEEYALLFTSSLREAELSTRLKQPAYAIGRITRERGVVLKGEGPLEARGFDHFA
ncbi:MAG TPA: thiamine-phosphate kinase [Thermoanaerobaculia bacterium]|nr:thiamine-phosphate kinase [Thermoanaerobaculia bacterium]